MFKSMQIYIMRNGQEVEVSDVVRTLFIDGQFSVYHHGKLYYVEPASLVNAFIVKRTGNDEVIVERVPIPETFSGKVGYCLSFEEKKLCASYEEFLSRVDDVKAVYPSKKFVTETDGKSYAFLVAKKKDRRIYAPLLLWVSDTISATSLTLLLGKYKKYRKIYHPEEFRRILLEDPNRPLI